MPVTGGLAWRAGALRNGSWRLGSWRGELTLSGVVRAYSGQLLLLPSRTSIIDGGASTNVVQLLKLKDEVSGQYPDPSTITATMQLVVNASGLAVAGSDLTLTNVEGTTGANAIYQAALPPSLVANLPLNVLLTLTLTVEDDDDNEREWFLMVSVTKAAA